MAHVSRQRRTTQLFGRLLATSTLIWTDRLCVAFQSCRFDTTTLRERETRPCPLSAGDLAGRDVALAKSSTALAKGTAALTTDSIGARGFGIR